MLNLATLPFRNDLREESQDLPWVYFRLLEEVKGHLELPLVVKMVCVLCLNFEAMFVPARDPLRIQILCLVSS